MKPTISTKKITEDKNHCKLYTVYGTRPAQPFQTDWQLKKKLPCILIIGC